MTTEMLTVLVVDDHPMFRKGLCALLATLPQVTIVGEATSGVEAIQLANSLQPQLILMDLQMPHGDGLSAIREITATHPHIHILVVTMFQDDDSVFAALRAGARGYVLKDMDDPELSRAILAVGHGDAIFSAALAARVMTFLTARSPATTSRFPELTASERKVLQLMARGLNNHTIAQQLTLSPKTVRNYTSAIFSKLHVADRAQAIVRANKDGLE